jgi:rod shape-determining protein MreC
MLRRPHYIGLGLVVLLTVVMLTLPSPTRTRLKLGVGSSFVPLFGLDNSARQAAGRAGDALLPKSELLRELEALRLQDQQLRLAATQAEAVLQQNDRLRQLLGWQRQQPWKLKLANVVLREPANWWRTVQIDLGSRDGIRTNMPVLTPEGLVGRIDSVGLTRSQVVLLGDPTCKVAARVDNPARDSGVIGPGGALESEFVEMSYLSPNAVLKPGQTVKTSGDGGIFPPNIPVGRVVESHPVDYGLSTVARVKLGANLSALEEVWVMLQP